MFYADTQICTHSLQAQYCQLLLREEAAYIYRKLSKSRPVPLGPFLGAWLWLRGIVQVCGDLRAVTFEVRKEKSARTTPGSAALPWDGLKGGGNPSFQGGPSRRRPCSRLPLAAEAILAFEFLREIITQITLLLFCSL